MPAIVTPAEMAAIDAAAPEPLDELVARAGWAVARAALDLLGGTYGRRVVIVAGKGNNGADGRAAARVLRRRGVRCTVLDAATATAPAVLPPADLVIDAAYGTGFRGSYDAPTPADPATPVLAVDIVSGIDGTTGVASGSPATATVTVTFAALKPGLLLADGAERSGRIEVADIGLDVSSARAHLVTDADLARWAPPRARATHKWRHAAWIVAGSPGMTGAAHLAVRGAQRAGAGYVRLSTPGSDTDRFAPTEAVVVALPAAHWAGPVIEDAGRFAALAVGPGLGSDDDDAAQVRAVVADVRAPMVVDGDGLRALGRDAGRIVAERTSTAGPVVLTPHDGEYEALVGRPPGADRFAAARYLAAATGAVVLLKGPTTIVARPDGPARAVTAGDARLATAGTGDVLTGIVTALLAQGLPADVAAAAAAHVHGRAGALASPRGLVAGDVADHLPAALVETFGA